MRAVHAYAISRGAAASNPTTNLNWKALGPAPLISDPSGGQDYGLVSGRSTRVLVDQSDTSGNTVYVGGAFGGLWKSTNAAAADPASVVWTPLLDSQPTLAVGAIALKPDNPSIVLVGTGEPNASGDSYYGLGILRSTDAGSTWTQIVSADSGAHPFRGLGLSRIAFHPTNTSLVVAAAASTNALDAGALAPGATLGLYYSQDAGLTWHFATVQDVGVTVGATSVTSVVYNLATQQFFAAVRYHGIYASSDGIVWTRLTNQPGGSALSSAACPASVLTTCPMYRGELALRPGSNEMYVWYVDKNEADQGIFQTPDGGNTWTALSVSGIDSCGDGPKNGCGTDQGAYNLTLAAVPTANGTDLYAGAVNIYKCSISSSNATCSNPGSWLNLTHVYGCTSFGATAHVHPDQHDIDFLRAAPNIIYFSNDGGIYRTLDGPGLTIGSCTGGTNPFDSLNGNLGSMTEFISFSQHPLDSSALLGGTQDVGSPAFSSVNPLTTGTTWAAVEVGDGGYSAINPLNGGEWFTSGTDVDIERCTQAPNCTQPTFKQMVSNTTVGGDHGDFYTPWILDTAATTSADGVGIVGTCRVWRGSLSTGSNWTALSNSLSGGAVPCSATDPNLIRSLAAGGSKTASGFQVIYAGTDGGSLWVTTQADAGPSSWKQRNVPMNFGYPISSIVVDRHDSTGQTAYATIMGFGVPHLWKTTNAGANWTDLSGTAPNALPDAPADSVAIDPASSKFLYVGTDVGVFVSVDGGTTWSEYGNILPAVPVTAMNTFVGGGARKLRISTYGRGIWEVDLPAVATDFDLAATATTPTSFAAGGSVSFNVALTPKAQNPGNITLTVTNLPQLTSYQFAGFGVNQPATVAASATITLTITTTQAAAVLNHLPLRRMPWYALGLALPALVLTSAGTARRSRRRWISSLGVVGLLLVAGIFSPSCGGGGSAASFFGRAGTPAGAYAVVIQGDSASSTVTTVVNFTVQ